MPQEPPVIQGAPKVIHAECSRDNLPFIYVDIINKNPCLGRIEGACRTVNWTDLEIRTAQLQAAVNSNASLMARLKEYEAAFSKTSPSVGT